MKTIVLEGIKYELHPIEPEPFAKPDPFGHLQKQFEPKAGWYINGSGKIIKTENHFLNKVCYNDLPTESDAERIRDLIQLMCLIHDWREGWEPKVNYNYYAIYNYGHGLSYIRETNNNHKLIWRCFDTAARCEAFIETHRELLERCRWML